MLAYQLNPLNEAALQKELELIGCDPGGITIMKTKLSRYTIKIIELSGTVGLIMKETALSCGAELALPRHIIKEPSILCDTLLLANKHQLDQIISKLKRQNFKQIRELLPKLALLMKEEKIKTPVIMGILNVTPDSFSDGGKFNNLSAALTQAKTMIEDGAKIIDIGGESTRPGSLEISTKEELNRTIPVIKAIHKLNKKIQISIDTTKNKVALEAVKAGATIINDISGLNRDPKIANIAAKYKTKLVLMHRLAPSKTMQKNPRYQDILKQILLSLENSVSRAITAGVKKENIIIDPGIGFGKTTEHNLYLINNLCAFKALGCPVLIGISRKSVIGNILKNTPEQRLAGTIATTVLSQLHNIDYLRVHDVKENNDALKMSAGIRRS